MRTTFGKHERKGDALIGEKAGSVWEVEIKIMRHHVEGWNGTKMY